MIPSQLTLDEAKNLIARGEDSSIEFKESYTDRIGRTLVAFANGFNGVPKGYLVLGVNDVGEIIGTQQTYDVIQRQITDLCRNNSQPPLSPIFDNFTIDSKQIVVVSVMRSQQRPHRFSGICYIRIGSTTRAASDPEEQTIRNESVYTPFDETVVPGITVEDIDLEKVQKYYVATRSKEVTTNDTRDLAFLAEQLGLLKRNGTLNPTVASVLMFGKNPQSIFKLSSVNAIRFRGTSIADPIADRREIIGTSDELIQSAVMFIDNFSAKGSVVTQDSIIRSDISEYPTRAIREAIANAVVHRDYSDSGAQIDIQMFDDRIEVISPGGLTGGLTKKDLSEATGKRHLRNPNLAGLLNELRLVEKAGTGIAKIFRDMDENGSSPPVFDIDLTRVKVILNSHPDYAARRKFEEALVAKDRGDIQRAMAFLDNAIKIKPNYSEAITVLASIEGEIGSVEKARQLYKTAMDKNPSNVSSVLSWALMEDRLGNGVQARSLYERASKAEPFNVYVWYSWGVLERKLGDFPKARRLFQRTVELAPTVSANWQALGQTELKAGSLQEGEKDLEKALEYAQDDYAKAWIHSDLAFAKSKQRKPSTEIEFHYKKSIELNPNSAETNYRYAWWLRNEGRNYEATEFERKASMMGWKQKKKFKKPQRR